MASGVFVNLVTVSIIFICMQNYRLDKSQMFTDCDFDHCRT